MEYAIELFFDPISDARIRRFWDRLARAGHIVEIEGRPNITLSVLEIPDLSSAEEMLTKLGSEMPRLAITFQNIGLFPGKQPAIFLNPVVNATMLAFHRRVHDGLLKSDAGPIAEAYRLGNWAPNCPLGQLTDQGALIHSLPYLNSIRLPFDVHAVVLGAVGVS